MSGRRSEILGDQVQGVADDGQVAEAQEVHFQKADRLDFAHGELGRDFALDRLVQGNEFGQRPRGDDQSGRVDRGMADLTFDLLGDGQEGS